MPPTARDEPAREVGPEPDPGLAAERTDIAWSRSALATITCLAVAARRIPAMSVAQRWAIAGVVVLGATVLGLLTAVRVRHATAPERTSIDAAEARLRVVARNTACVGVLCLAIVLVDLGLPA